MDSVQDRCRGEGHHDDLTGGVGGDWQQHAGEGPGESQGALGGAAC